MFVFSFNTCEETGKTKGRQNYNILVGVTNYYIKIWWTKNIGNLWFLICKNNNKPKATFETHFWNFWDIPKVVFGKQQSLTETIVDRLGDYLLFDDKKFAFETHANDLFKFIWNHKLPHAKNINAPTL